MVAANGCCGPNGLDTKVGRLDFTEGDAVEEKAFVLLLAVQVVLTFLLYFLVSGPIVELRGW